jgi:hypothetical protein
MATCTYLIYGPMTFRVIHRVRVKNSCVQNIEYFAQGGT